MWCVRHTYHSKWGCHLWWLEDPNAREGRVIYYPNDNIDSLADYLHSEAEAQIVCDQLNLRDYGCVDG